MSIDAIYSILVYSKAEKKNMRNAINSQINILDECVNESKKEIKKTNEFFEILNTIKKDNK